MLKKVLKARARTTRIPRKRSSALFLISNQTLGSCNLTNFPTLRLLEFCAGFLHLLVSARRFRENHCQLGNGSLARGLIRCFGFPGVATGIEFSINNNGKAGDKRFGVARAWRQMGL